MIMICELIESSLSPSFAGRLLKPYFSKPQIAHYRFTSLSNNTVVRFIKFRNSLVK